ncbi:MAG: hypothetical protein V4494_04230 [Chlamydiota bacterium]
MNTTIIKKLSLSAILLQFLIQPATYAVNAENILSDSQNTTTIDGVVARKGSIAATIANVRALNALMQEAQDSEALQEILLDQRALIPTLKVIGMFDLFSIDEWLDPTHGEGRAWVGVLYLEAFPEQMSASIQQLLKLHQNNYSRILNEEISKNLLMQSIN